MPDPGLTKRAPRKEVVLHEARISIDHCLEARVNLNLARALLGRGWAPVVAPAGVHPIVHSNTSTTATPTCRGLRRPGCHGYSRANCGRGAVMGSVVRTAACTVTAPLDSNGAARSRT